MTREDEELIGTLTAISVVSRRLAGRLIKLSAKGVKNDDCRNRKTKKVRRRSK